MHRGGPELTNFLSCLGLIRETRLTAVLGYLISRAPREFTRELLGRPLDVRSIRIEPSDEGSRYDVVLETRARRIVIEAKLGLAQRVGQVANYIARLGRPFNLVLVDRGKPSAADPMIRSLERYLPTGCHLISRSWEDVARVCERLARHRGFVRSFPLAAALAEDIRILMQEEGMASNVTGEVYVRQLSGSSLQLFFRHHVYKCQARFSQYASRHRYFAPLFTSKAPRDMPSLPT